MTKKAAKKAGTRTQSPPQLLMRDTDLVRFVTLEAPGHYGSLFEGSIGFFITNAESDEENEQFLHEFIRYIQSLDEMPRLANCMDEADIEAAEQEALLERYDAGEIDEEGRELGHNAVRERLRGIRE